MQAKKSFTPLDVQNIANLANIPVTPAETKKIADGFTVTMSVVDTLFTVDVKNIEPTHQVTGLSDITRTDEIDVPRMFTQDEALLNAKRTHNGFFVVDQILEEK
jgi:aspartyl/glutamyl-tRNA(Asn/Gln) amidotransferase C subunit